MVDHLSKLENSTSGENEQLCIDENFLDEQLFPISEKNETPWFADFANYLVAKEIPPELSYQ